MTTITRSSLINIAANDLGINQAREITPNTAEDKVRLTFDIGQKITNFAFNGGNALTTSVTIFTTPSAKDFYLTGALLAFTKDATCDNIVAYITVNISGVGVRINQILTQTTTAGSFYQYVSFPFPIKCDRASAISLTGAFGAGTMSKQATIYGYVLE
jgi:hypothetical protein